MTDERELDALRRELAEALGYTNLRIKRYAIFPKYTGDLVGEHEGEEVHVPDWPRDAGAALALCRDILKRRKSLGLELLIDWDFEKNEVEVDAITTWYNDHSDGERQIGLQYEEHLTASGATEAEAISKLSLLIMRRFPAHAD